MSASLIPFGRKSILDTFFNDFWDEPLLPSRWVSRTTGLQYEDTNTHFKMKLDVAGVDPDTIKVKVKNGVLEISYPKVQETAASEKEIPVEK